jgi:hypothetical protein
MRSTPFVGISFTGGFGNNLFQYAFGRAYAEARHATLLTPKWIGQDIFNLSDPLLNIPLPPAGFDVIPTGAVNITLSGYFQFQAAIDFMSRSQLKRWFTLQDRWKQRFTTHLSLAAHVRRGDYVNLASIFCLVSENSYISACNKFGLDLTNISWVQDGRQQPSHDLVCLNLPFLEDFVSLMNADVLLRANSSFSWWAGTLGNGRIFSPLVEDRVGMQDVEFVEGNWPRMVDGRNCRSNISDLHLKE